MSADQSRGMSLKTVAVLTLSLVSYLLWGGAAAIYKAHLDQTEAALAAQQAEDAGEFETDGVTPRIRFRRGGGLATAVVVMIAGLWMFVSNSVIQLGHLPSSIPYMVTQRMGYLVFCAGVLTLTGLGLFWMGRMQQSLESENPFSKGRQRKKLPKIRTPQPVDDD